MAKKKEKEEKAMKAFDKAIKKALHKRVRSRSSIRP